MKGTNKIKKILILCGIVLLIIVGAAATFFIINNNSQDTVLNDYETIDPSGAVIYNSGMGPEIQEDIVFIGFQVFYTYGFSASQQNEIQEQIKSYLLSNYPDTNRVSFLKDSFRYQDDDHLNLSSFKFVTNEDKKFSVNLDTYNSLDSISVKITNS